MTAKLSFCLKAATTLGDQDLAAITDSIEAYARGGMDMRQAEAAAVDDVIAQVAAERADMVALVREQHADLFDASKRPAPAPPAAPKPEPADAGAFPTLQADLLDAAAAPAPAPAAAQKPVLPPTAPAVDTPAFKRWFGDSKIVNADGTPKVMYHGTAQDVTEFRPKQAESIFLTDDPRFAETFAAASESWMRNNGKVGSPTVMPLYVKAENPFDFRSAEAREKVATAALAQIETYEQGDGNKALVLDGKRTLYTKPVLEEGFKKGDWLLIEDKSIQQVIRGLGYDSYRVMEDGRVNLAVYKPTQVKSASKNSGAFDEANPDIRMDLADQTDTPAFKKWFAGSKVVDADGKPQMVYHGTPATGIKVFDMSRIGANGRSEGPGAYFTTDETIAKGYGQKGEVIAAYLNIQKPLDYNAKAFSQPQIEKLLKSVATIEARETDTDWKDGFLSNYEDTYTLSLDAVVRKAAKSFAGEETALDQIGGIIGSGVDAQIVNDAVTQALGYDGYHSNGFSGEGGKGGTLWVAMRSNQIKSATENAGTFDAKNPDIRADFSGEQLATADVVDESPASDRAVEVTQEVQKRFNEAVPAFKNLRLTPLPPVAKPAADAPQQTKERYAAQEVARQLFGRELVYFSSNLQQFANGLSPLEHPGVIMVNEGTTKPVMAVMGHELLHSMRKSHPELYNRLRDRLDALLEDPGRYGLKLNAAYGARGIPTLSDDKLHEELLANIVGDNFTDPLFWSHLSTGQPNLFQRVLGAVREFFNQILRRLKAEKPYGTELYMKDVRAVRAAVVEAMSDFAEDQRAAAAQADTSWTAMSESNEPFYSELGRQVGLAKMGRAPASGWKDWLRSLHTKGVKADEIAWTGLEDWLDLQPGKVTRDQVLDYLRGSGVQLTETELRGSAGYRPGELDSLLDQWANRNPGATANSINSGEPWNTTRRIAERNGDAEVIRMIDAADGNAKYQQYTLPGGTNYREVLLTLPAKDNITMERVKSPAGWGDTEGGDVGIQRTGDNRSDFRSGHWDQPNVVAHLRVNDRVDADGKKVLFIEEIQSDWGQAGKRHGFKGDPTNPTDAEIREYFGLRDGADPSEYRDEMVERLAKRDTRVPDGPFVRKTDAWVSLALKRAIKMAVDGGYDRIAFVNGQQSADRYDLSKQVGRIVWNEERSQLWAYDVSKKNRIVDHNDVKAEDLPDFIGKEAAQRLVDAQPNNIGIRQLEGDGLKMGGEGMKTFYDQIVPKVAKEVVRKLGGEGLTTVEFETKGLHEGERMPGGAVLGPGGLPPEDVKQLGFDITDAMREKAAGGLPMFSIPDYTPEERAALAKAGIDTRTRLQRAGDRIRAFFPRIQSQVMSNWGRQFQQGFVDQFTGIAQAVKNELGGLPVDQDPYVAARLANGGTSSVMRGLLLHGQARWAPNKQHLEKIPGTKGLLEILEPLGPDLNDFFGWMIGNRAARLMAEGRENNFTAEDIAALKALGNGKEEKFRAAALQYAAFKRSVLDIAEQSGLIQGESRKVWDQADYIPFYRQIDDKAVFSATGKRGLAGQSSGIRQLRGGEAALNDPMENIIMNFSRLVDASLKNNAIRKTVYMLQEADSDIVKKVGYDMGKQLIPADQVRKVLEDAGTVPAVIDMIPSEAFEGMAKMWAIQAPNAPDVVRVMNQGKPEFYQVNDPLLLKSLTSFVPFDFPGLGVMRAFKRLLTGMVTATPEFMIRNFIRDSVATQMVGKDGINPLSSLTGIVKSYTEAGGFENMLFAGASFQSGQINAGDPVATAKAARRALRKKGFAAASQDISGTILDTPAKFWEAYRHVGEAIENANREAVYEATTKAGKSETAAAFESKDLMDFTLRGSSPIYQFMADVLPFFNARVQGLYRLGRADRKRLATYGLLMLAASVALVLANGDNPEYDQLPDWDKDTYWHVWIGGKHFRIPKPFELGVIFATLPERVTQYLKGHDSGKKLISRVFANIRDQLAIDPVPQLIRPGLNAAYNHDSFRDRPIETMADEGKLPSRRFGPYTSATARAAVDALNVRVPGTDTNAMDAIGLSPKKLEYLIGGYLGTTGLYALGLSDMAVKAMEGAPPSPKPRLDDYPVIRSFYRMEPARATQFESDFYELRTHVEQVYKTIMAEAKDGNVEKAVALRDQHAKALAVREAVTDVGKRLSLINKARDNVYLSRDMTPLEKRTELDRLQTLKNDLLRRAMKQPAIMAAQ